MKVTVLDDYQRVALSSADWSAVAARAEIASIDRHLDGEALVDALADSEVVVLMRERTGVPASLLDRLPTLRLIVTTGPFNAAVDVGAAVQRGIVVCGTGGDVQPTVELTWALILGLARSVAAEDAAIRAGGWQTDVGTGLSGKTLGIVGLGRIGRRVARIAPAFRMATVAWSENLDPDEAAARGVRPVSKAELFACSDVVSIHLVLSSRTRGLVGRAELDAMRPTALLVNTSRGPIVDEEALVEVLTRGRIAGAALDVYGTEPLPADSPIRLAPRTLLTPHIGYVTRESYSLFYRDVVEDIVAFWDGSPIRVIEA
jgi:phosphoglycerate dehydrogenase-like enzyme